MKPRWRHNVTVLTLALVLLSACAGCGGGGGSDGDKASTKTSTTSAKPDKTAFCRLWNRFQTSTSYHPDMAAYRAFWRSNDLVATQLVAVAPDVIADDVNALAKGVASIRDAVGHATSARTWSPQETKLYLKQVRLPEIQVSNYADQECPPAS